MSDLNNHVRCDKIKWIITAIALVLAFVMLAGVFMQVFLPDGQRPTDWFDREPSVEDGDESEGAVIEQTKNNGVRLMTAKIAAEKYSAYGISALAESAYSLTAAITPESTTYKDVDYVAEWANPSSEWASGKNVSDYVSLKQTADGSLTATVEVLQPFSEQVVIEVTLRRDPKISASCTVDYVATYDLSINKTAMSSLSDSFMVSLNNVAGTLAFNTEDLLEFVFYVPANVYTGLQERGVEVNDDCFTFNLTPTEQGSTGEFLSGYTTGPFYSMERLIELYYEQQVTDMDYDDFFVEICEAYLDGRYPEDCGGEEIFKVDIRTDRIYGDQSYGRIDLENTSVTLTDWSAFEVKATGMTINNSGIVAG